MKRTLLGALLAGCLGALALDALRSAHAAYSDSAPALRAADGSVFVLSSIASGDYIRRYGAGLEGDHPTAGEVGAQSLLNPTTTIAATPPASGATTTSTGSWGCFIWGSFAFAGTALTPANVTMAIETGSGSGTYASVAESGVGVGLALQGNDAYFFFVPTGRRWRFSHDAGLGTETHSYTSRMCL